MSNSLQPYELQHTRLHYPSISVRVCSNSCPLSQWCHLTISSFAALFSICLQSFPGSGSFPVTWLLASGGQSTGALASASVLPNEYSGLISFRIDWFDLLAVQGTLKSLLQHHSSKAVSSSMLLLSCLQSSHVFNIHSNFLVKPSEVEDTFSDRIMKFYNDLEKCILT